MNFQERNAIEGLVKQVNKMTEKSLGLQLNEMIKKGLLVVEYGQHHLVDDVASQEIQFRQEVKLKLRDAEYIKKLEDENTLLKEKLISIKNAFNNIN